MCWPATPPQKGAVWIEGTAWGAPRPEEVEYEEETAAEEGSTTAAPGPWGGSSTIPSCTALIEVLGRLWELVGGR